MAPQPLDQIYGLSGKTALVTGGGSGIGKAIAQCLAASGAKVIIAGRRADVLEATAAEIGPVCATALLDITDIGAIAAFEAALTEAHGPIDILINNAGNTLKKPFEESSIADFDAVFDVHVRGALELSRYVIRRNLAAARPGSICFISSMTAYIGQPMVHGYTIAKTAINGVVRGLSAEFAARGIRVNGVAPGWIDTELYRKATQGDLPRQQKILGRIPMQALGQPEDIGWACAFLSSPAAKYINGQVLLVDGGGATGF
ncbi:SDR family NAD(P)-dependent oxidoreductase [Pseudoruegeria sp. SHC-113]|uniref:SDR family NAD(P)-dependent oxidoreductase n=1 Tax=Pseudoruegeria sp. SHC-113 TaxID=2855439 RepID=UPI0021BB01B9|nr:SDR family oxidoreductase [Pseudoruegeria sp. SHC-113]MCT8160666.1 SDR family oxidoreductase [Pseudoruegeria sp. SHC-113]